MGEEEADLDPWNGQGVRLKAFEEDEKATTVSYVKARLERSTEQQQEAEEEQPEEDVEPKSTDRSPLQLTPDAEIAETNAICTQLRRALDRVCAYEREINATDQLDDDAQTRDDQDDVDVPLEPLEPRRRRRTRALRRRSASPASSTSSSGNSVDAERPVRRSQHELSHARAERLQRQRQRPTKVDAALTKRQRSLNRVTKPVRELAVSAQTLEAHVRQRAFSLDGQAGWASLPIQRRSSNGEFVVRRYNAFLADETELQAPAVDWKTLRMAREKCTEWLVKHVLLPDAIPRLRNPKPRIA